MIKCLSRAFVAAFSIALTILLASGSSFAHSTPLPIDVGQIHQVSSPGGAKTKAVKAGVVLLAKALRSEGLSAFITYVRSNGTKEAAAIIAKNAATIARTLDGLVAWEELTTLMVRGQVIGASKTAGLAESNAKLAGFWIEQVLTGLFL